MSNELKNILSVMLFGAFMGMVVFVSLISYTQSYHTMAKDAITECEKSLPRDQHCKVIAVPKDQQ